MNILEDEDQMPWGIHKGKEMQEVPASYLLHQYESNKCCKQVKAYVEDNLDVLKHEIAQNQNSNH